MYASEKFFFNVRGIAIDDIAEAWRKYVFWKPFRIDIRLYANYAGSLGL